MKPSDVDNLHNVTDADVIAAVQRWPSLRWFVVMMAWKLDVNRHKGGWLGDRASSLLKRVREETDELRDALAGSTPFDAVSTHNVICEAIDVANMAMMVADVEREARQRIATVEERRAPVLGDTGDNKVGTIAWWEHEEAWCAYRDHGFRQDAEWLAAAGGFTLTELVDFLGHEPTTWKPRGGR